MEIFGCKSKVRAALVMLVGSIGLGLGCDASSNSKVKQDTPPTAQEGTQGEQAAGAEGAEGAEEEGADEEQLRSKKKRLTQPQASEGAKQALVAGNTQFALELYRQVSQDAQNVFYSPFSISEALAMTYAGARGETELQMSKVLHFDRHQPQVHPAFNWLDASIMALGKDAKNEDQEPFQLSIANSIWGERDYQFKADFLDTLAENYGAGLRTLDFSGAPDAARKTINEWVEKKTKERIKDLLPDGMIQTDTRLVLANAVYFKASWMSKFQKENTEKGDFHRADKSTVQADLMRQKGYFKYAELEGYRALSLPYDGGDVSMLILLPEEIGAFESGLKPEVLDAALGALEQHYVDVMLPKFEFSQRLGLAETLQKMGMTDAFGGAADFSGMTDSEQLFISNVVHKAFVAVDETGTEAAAATAVAMMRTSLPPEPVEFRADKPFIFMIRDDATGSLLFVGRVMDPSADD